MSSYQEVLEAQRQVKRAQEHHTDSLYKTAIATNHYNNAYSAAVRANNILADAKQRVRMAQGDLVNSKDTLTEAYALKKIAEAKYSEERQIEINRRLYEDKDKC